MYFISIYENRRMKPADIALRKGEGGKGRTTEGVNLTKVYCKDMVNITMYSPVQLLYANKIKIYKL
jgi:hypothetical protein